MMDMYGYGHGWGFGGFGIFSILFWILIIVGIVIMLRGYIQKDSSEKPKSDESPLTILKKRYAKGEIDDETFKRMKKELED